MSAEHPKILAIDTATEACSAALLVDGESTTQYTVAPREHSRLILKMVDQLLSEAAVSVADLDAVAFGRGPGSFMGLRIAAGVAQGIAFAHELPVIPVSTLQAIAQQAYEATAETTVLAAIDARMDEAYWCPYRLMDGRWQALSQEQVISPDKVSLPAALKQSSASCIAAGTGWGTYGERLRTALDSTAPGCQPTTTLADCLPSAQAMVTLAVTELAAGNAVSAAEAVPVYLRNDVAKKPKAVAL